jgi:hypothetical protein
MRKFLLLTLTGLVLLSNSGCFLPIYSSDRVRRMNQLLYTSENLRLIEDEWERIWFLDQPAHTTPFRTHGGTGL